MNNIIEWVSIVVIAVMASTVIYRLLPFREWGGKKPGFVLFPKYVARTDMAVSEIESALEAIEFKRNESGNYSRGKVYGDFSAKSIKLTVEIDETENQIKVYASFFGVLFDTGDLWQLTSDIVNS